MNSCVPNTQLQQLSIYNLSLEKIYDSPLIPLDYFEGIPRHHINFIYTEKSLLHVKSRIRSLENKTLLVVTMIENIQI